MRGRDSEDAQDTPLVPVPDARRGTSHTTHATTHRRTGRPSRTSHTHHTHSTHTPVEERRTTQYNTHTSHRRFDTQARTKAFLVSECERFCGAPCHFVHAAKAGSSSVAARQYRVTVDFRLADVGPRAPSVHPLGLPLRGSQKVSGGGE